MAEKKVYKHCTIIDYVIVIFVISGLAYAVYEWIILYSNPQIIFEKHSLSPIAQKFYISIAMLQPILFVLWLLKGGAESPLWNWLPPFCFFHWLKKWQKSTIIIILIVIGIISVAKAFM